MGRKKGIKGFGKGVWARKREGKRIGREEGKKVDGEYGKEKGSGNGIK